MGLSLQIYEYISQKNAVMLNFFEIQGHIYDL